MRDDESHEHYDKILCDDCYMTVLSPARTCDPWAVHSAKRLETCSSQELAVNETQGRILEFLKQAGDAEPAEIYGKLKIDPDQFEREIAALRHAEKVRGQLKDGKKVIRLW
jgi:predicted HTH transcriptional regulator